jgi:hypothetical protein
MSGNNYTRVREGKDGRHAEAGQIVGDPYSKLVSKSTTEPAKVAIGLSESLDFGSMKVSVTVSLACDQNELTINKAGELAFNKALELLRDSWGEFNKGGG